MAGSLTINFNSGGNPVVMKYSWPERKAGSLCPRNYRMYYASFAFKGGCSFSNKVKIAAEIDPVLDFQYLATYTAMRGVTHADLLHVTASVLTNQHTSSLTDEELSIAITAMEKLASVAPNFQNLQVSEAVEKLLGINKLLEHFLNGQTLDVVMEITVLSERITTMYAQQTTSNQTASTSLAGSVIFVENIDRASTATWFTIGGEGDVQRKATSLQDDFTDVSAAIHCDVENIDDVEGTLSVAVVYNDAFSVGDGGLNDEFTELALEGNITVLEQSLISGILSFSVTDDLKKHSVPVTFTLQHMEELDNEEQTILVNGKTRRRRTRAMCVFWRESRRIWSDDGCSLISDSSTTHRSSCRCDHTTSFAILMQVTEYEVPEVHKTALKWLTYIGCSISLVALVLTIFIFTYLGSLRSDRTFIHKNLVVALMISDLLFIAGVGETEIKIACKVIAILLHLFYLSVFSWMLVEGLHLYNMVVRVFGSETSRWKLYCLVGWGLPVFVVGVTTAVDHDGYGSDSGCWLIVERGFVWAFVGPAIGIIVVNMAVMCMVVRIIVQSASTTSGSRKEQAKVGVKGAILLLPLLGLTWAFGLMATNSDTIVFQYLFTIFNSLQGLFFFTFHCLMNSEVRQAWRLKRKQIMLSRGEFIDSNSISALGLNATGVRQAWRLKRKQIMLSRGEFIDSNSISALGLNATGSSKQSDLTCNEYIADPEEIRTSNLSTIHGSSFTDKGNYSGTNVQDIRLEGGPVTRPRKRRLQPVLRSETPIEESIPGAILEDTDLMEEVRVTHRIIENDDWTVEEKRHVTRKLMKKKRSTDQSEPTDDASYGNAASTGYAGPAPPPYAPQYSAAARGAEGGAATNGNKKDDSSSMSRGSIDLAIQNALFNGGCYPQYSKDAGKGNLPVPRGKGNWPVPQGAKSKVDLPTSSGSSAMENSSVPSCNEEATVDLTDYDSDTFDISSSNID